MVDYSGDIGCFTIGFSGIGVVAPCPIPPGTDPAIEKTIRAYLYWQYKDDDDLQAFVDAYNTITQEFVDWFNALQLPIYTGGVVRGLLLDWVAAGIYGATRPVLASGQQIVEGPLDTYTLDSIPLDDRVVVQDFNYIPTTDDIFRRVITWHFNKGDGRTFTIRWLKRRIVQFLTGSDGVVINPDQTYRVSVSLGLDGQVNITILKYQSSVAVSSCLDAFTLDSIPLDYEVLDIVDLGPQFPLADAFKDAVDTGVLELPFQITPVVVVQH